MLNLASIEQNNRQISVVIATLGGNSLEGTIEKLNRGTLVPSEILICIPEEDSSRVRGISSENVRVIATTCRGQVAQRAIGFQQAQCPMVMQLDDDILLQENALQFLSDALVRMGRGNAVAPLYFDVLAMGLCHEIRGGFIGWLNNVFTYFVCGAPWGVKRMGVMTDIGTCYGVDYRYCGSNQFETQWLPGGCVLSFKEDLIIDSFFPYNGKAFCEDLIHSFLRNRNGVRHWVIADAHCFMDVPKPDENIQSRLAQQKAQRYFVSLRHGPAWRLVLYEALKRVKHILTNIAGRMKS